MLDLSLLQDFIVETSEHLEEMENDLLKLETDPENREILNDIFRAAHTIKGSSEYLGMEKIANLSHKLENLLEILRRGDHSLDKDIIDTLIDSRDRIAVLVSDLEKTQTEKASIEDLIDRIDHLAEFPDEKDRPGEAAETVSPSPADQEEDMIEDDSIFDDGEEADMDNPIEKALNLFEDLKVDLYDVARSEVTDDKRNKILSTIDAIIDVAESMESGELVHRLENLKKQSLTLAFSDDAGDILAEMHLLVQLLKTSTTESSLPDEMDVDDGDDDPETYEEEYDDELFGIFIQHMKENIATLLTKIGAFEQSDDPADLFGACIDIINSLHSSANYMDYRRLTRLYDRWVSRIEKEVEAIDAGDEYEIEFMDDYIQDILKMFPGQEILPEDAPAPEMEKIDEFSTFEEFEEDEDADELGDLPDLGALVEKEDEKTDDSDMDEEELPDLDGFLDETDDSLSADAADQEGQSLEPPVAEEMLEDDDEIEYTASDEEDINVTTDYHGLFEELDSTFVTVVDEQDADSEEELSLEEDPGESISPEQDGDEDSEMQMTSEEGASPLDEELEAVIPEKKKSQQPEIRMEAIGVETTASSEDEPEDIAAPESPLYDDGVTEPEDELSEAMPKEGPKYESTPEKVAKHSFRVDASKIDTLMNQVGELVVSRAWFSQLFNEMRMLQQHLQDEVKLEQKEMKQVKNLTFKISEATTALGRVANELQESVMKVRMLPIAQLFNRYPRLVRDLTHNTDKKVELIIIGEETELDRMVIEEISDPLIHIIRNAVDHGCETIEERKKSGKTEDCKIKLESYHESNHVVIEISDDGRGIDPKRIKAAAIAKGFSTVEEMERLSIKELISIIMKPGFSTAQQVSKTSGRGVGMDVVKQNIEKLNGTIEVESKVGVGTRFRIKIPLTLAIIQALLVRVGPEIFTIPLAAVEETLRIFEKDITTIEGIECIHLRDTTLSLLRLSEIFNIETQTMEAGKVFVVVVNTGMRRVGLVVDAMIGQEECVIKPLVDYLQENSGLSGATILGDGRISLILDVYELISISIGRHSKRRELINMMSVSNFKASEADGKGAFIPNTML